MANYIFSNKAVFDLTQIWNYIFNKWSENQADIYYRMLIENCIDVACNPDLCKVYTGISENLLGFKAGRYIIFYRVIDKNEIEILRILHEQMDLRNKISDK